MATELPADLLALGFKLIVRAPDRMFAVSSFWGCTGTKATIADVIHEARDLSSYLQRRTAANLRNGKGKAA